MSEERDEERMRRILGRSRSLAVPPFDQVRRAPAPSGRRSVAVTVAILVVAVAALYGGRELATFRQQQASPPPGVAAPSATASAAPAKVVLPQPIPQPITRTSAAAQVAWVSSSELNAALNGRNTVLVGIDPNGRIVGRIDGAAEPSLNRTWRSADGATLVTVGDTKITLRSALDGTIERTYPRDPQDGLADGAFSPDGRWFAYIGVSSYVQVVDLRAGTTQTTPLSRSASSPGSGSTLVFGPDSKRLYTIVDWASPRITAFDVTSTGLVQTASVVDGQSGKTFPGCGGPGVALKVVDEGRTLVLYCHVDGSVAFIDLPTLTTTATLRAEMKNPFWLAPIFTPDGQLLYLHQYPAFGDFMQVVDLRSHQLLGPVPTPTKVDQPGPFSWLFGVAYAGGTPSTVPVSPDGLKLYAESNGGVTVLRVPDLKPLAKLAQGQAVNEVWVSGDGRTVFATDGGKTLFAIREDGAAQPIAVTLPIQIDRFIASEHG